jgi:aminotransferase
VRKSVLAAEGTKFLTKGISKRVKDIMVSPIKEMRMIAQNYSDVISFGQGIPFMDTSEEIRKRLAQTVLTKDISKYSVSPGLLELREKLAIKLKDIGIMADPKTEIMITNGAMEGIFCAVMTLVNKDDEVLMFTPGFSSHIEQVMLAGGKPVFSDLKEKDWGIDFEDLNSKITKKTKLIIVSNPNNPTGTVYRKEDILRLAEIAKENDLFVIADDPYNFLVYEGEYVSISSIPGMKERTVSCFSFSKEYAMTGYRLGYVVSSQEILNQMMKVHDACSICAPVISQHAGIIALDSGSSASDCVKDALSKNREIIIKGLKEIKGINFVVPNGAYYVLIKYDKKQDSVDMALDILKKVQVETVPGSAFGPSGEGHLRLSFGGRPEQIKEGLRRLKRYFEAEI